MCWICVPFARVGGVCCSRLSIFTGGSYWHAVAVQWHAWLLFFRAVYLRCSIFRSHAALAQLLQLRCCGCVLRDACMTGGYPKYQTHDGEEWPFI
jgi:hypothetical protein